MCVTRSRLASAASVGEPASLGAANVCVKPVDAFVSDFHVTSLNKREARGRSWPCDGI